MGIGIPGSGKSTALRPFAERCGYLYVSSDSIREELFGEAADQSHNGEVWDEVHKRVAGALRGGNTVVVDATFVRDTERKQFIQFARAHGADKVQGVYANIPYEIASERNERRERTVPSHAMERMYAILNKRPPALEDGFDSMFEINELQELTKTEIQHEGSILVREGGRSLR